MLPTAMPQQGSTWTEPVTARRVQAVTVGSEPEPYGVQRIT
jgi:hypothetical protein